MCRIIPAGTSVAMRARRAASGISGVSGVVFTRPSMPCFVFAPVAAV